MAAAGGLHVVLTELHESKRIDRQLQGRAGRQGDPGSTRTFASLEDDLAERFMPKLVRRVLGRLFPAPDAPAAEGWRAALLGWWLRRAQRAAEAKSFRQRRLVIEQDQQLAESLIPGRGPDNL